MSCVVFFFQAEDGIRDAQESRGLGDVYKRQDLTEEEMALPEYTFDQFCADVDASLISGRPNVRERSNKRGTKYISEEMDKFKNK